MADETMADAVWAEVRAEGERLNGRVDEHLRAYLGSAYPHDAEASTRIDNEGGTTKRVVVRGAIYLWEPTYGWCHYGPDGLDFVDEYHAATLDALHRALARPTPTPTDDA